MLPFIADDDDMTDLAEAIMEDCDGEVSESSFQYLFDKAAF